MRRIQEIVPWSVLMERLLRLLVTILRWFWRHCKYRPAKLIVTRQDRSKCAAEKRNDPAEKEQ